MTAAWKPDSWRGKPIVQVPEYLKEGETIRIDADYVKKHVGDLAKNADLSRFIL